MISKEVVISNQVGLHARPATFFIQKANEYKASIWVEKDDRRVNAKSLLGVLSLGIVKGTAITIIADGSDEEEAVAALSALIAAYVEEKGLKNGRVLWPLRTAVSGKQMTPGGAYEIMEILGKEESLRRIRNKIEKLEEACR